MRSASVLPKVIVDVTSPSPAVLNGYDTDTLVSLLRDRRNAFGSETACSQKRDGKWYATTWTQYASEVAQLSRALVDGGLKRGDYVALMGDVSREWVIALMATVCAGGVAVGIYFTSSTEEVDYYLEDSAAKFMFVAGEQELATVRRSRQAKDLKKIIVFADGTPAMDGAISLKDFVGTASADGSLIDDQAALASPDDVCCIVYTSGTTGMPKGAMLTHRSLIEGLASLRCLCPAVFSEDQRVVVHLPISHVVGLGQGVLMALIGKVVPYFGDRSADFATTMREVRPTYWMAPPRFYQRYAAELISKINASAPEQRKSYELAMSIGRQALADRQSDGPDNALLQSLFETCRKEVFLPLLAEIGFDQLRYAYTASAPMPSDVMKLWQTWGVNLKECYGQTELVGTNAGQVKDWSEAGTIGEPICDPRWQTRIAPDGEMLVKGPGLFVGYLNKPEATEDALRDGWLHTGDIVEMSDDGLLTLVDRKKEIINTSGGKSISPAQIENELRQSPYISEAAVCGDGKKYLVALIEVDPVTVMDWAKSRNLPVKDYADLCQSEAVVNLIEGELSDANQRLAKVEQIKAFRILPEELSVENGVMTATRKKRRKNLNQRYKDLIESLYDDTEDEIIRRALS